MRNYWSCSRFADWLRGTPKPHAETSKGWRVWNELAEKSHPVRYWIAEELLDRVQSFLRLPIDTIYGIKYYINNRWVTRTHCLTAHPRDIRPGTWQDVGYRFLPCLFNELVDYVEQELAWWHIVWEGPEFRKKYNAPFWATGWFRWRTWRCKQAGLDNLEWQMSLTNKDYTDENDPTYGDPTPQARNAQEILELYTWWTEVYRNRPDPHDVSGWSAYCEMKRQRGDDFFDTKDRSPEDAEMSRIALDKLQEIEQAYDDEDEAMMIRLIKIRRALWT